MSKKATTQKTEKVVKKAEETHDHAAHDHDHSDHDHAGHTHAQPAKHPHVIENSKITITIPWSEVKVAYDKVLQRAAQHVKADGFRKGKVPANIAEGMIKPSALFEETVQIVLPPAYSKAIQDAKKLPISQPEVDPVQMEKDIDWIFDIYFAEKQPLELGEYQKEVKKAIKAAEEEIKNADEAIQKEKKGKDEKSEKAAEAKPLTDEQKEDIKIRHIFRNLIEKIQPKVQEILIRSEVNRELQRLADQLNQLSIPVDSYLSSRQMTVEQLRQEYAISALSTLQLEFILGEVARVEKMDASEQEINDILDKVENGKLTEKQRQNPDYRSYVFSTIVKQKVVKHLLSLN